MPFLLAVSRPINDVLPFVAMSQANLDAVGVGRKSPEAIALIRGARRDPVPMTARPPILVYDGDCAICRVWVAYWQGLTQGAVIFRPYQEAAADFPAIPREAFA